MFYVKECHTGVVKVLICHYLVMFWIFASSCRIVTDV